MRGHRVGGNGRNGNRLHLVQRGRRRRLGQRRDLRRLRQIAARLLRLCVRRDTIPYIGRGARTAGMPLLRLRRLRLLRFIYGWRPYHQRDGLLRLGAEREEDVHAGQRQTGQAVLEHRPGRVVALGWRGGKRRTEQRMIWQPSSLQFMLWSRIRGRISRQVGQFSSVQLDVW